MTVQRFEDLKVWKKSQDLAVSISNNIAEGFKRNTNPDFKRFLYFSLASNSEVRFMLYLSERLNYLNKQDSSKLINETNEISKMLYAFIK